MWLFNCATSLRRGAFAQICMVSPFYSSNPKRLEGAKIESANDFGLAVKATSAYLKKDEMGKLVHADRGHWLTWQKGSSKLVRFRVGN